MGIIVVYRRMTWGENMADRKGYPKVLVLQEGFPCYKALHRMGSEAGDRVVLVNPSEIVVCMRAVPYGQVTTLREICQKIARGHDVDAFCTLTSGIHMMTAANAAAEVAERGGDLEIPYWRTLKIDSYLDQKYPGGVDKQARHLQSEGHQIVGKGKNIRVSDFERTLFRF